MTSVQAAYQIKEGLNKLDSKDYQNIMPNSMQDAVNTSVQRFIRRRVRRKETDNLSVEDIQVLLKTSRLAGSTKEGFFLSHRLPSDYFALSKVVAICTKDACTGRRISSELIEDANSEEYLGDWASQPSFDFEQTFHTLNGNKIKQYTGGDFEVDELDITYYQQPQFIQFEGAELPDGSDAHDMTWQWKDDVADMIIEEAISILAKNTGDYNTYQASAGTVQQP